VNGGSYFKKERKSIFYTIYIIKELVLKQRSKFYASGGNVANLRGKQGCQKYGGERELKIKTLGGGGGDTCSARVGPTNLLYKCPEEHRFQAAGNERKKEF
jgi:hypothetical protein